MTDETSPKEETSSEEKTWRPGLPIPPERREEARRLYETTDLSQAKIGLRVGLFRQSIGRIAKAEGWVRPKRDKREQVVRRIRARVDREMSIVEATLGDSGLPDEADRVARTLASLVRTLRELQKYDEDAARRRLAEAGDEDGAPADLDALRDALAERLERMRRGDE